MDATCWAGTPPPPPPVRGRETGGGESGAADVLVWIEFIYILPFPREGLRYLAIWAVGVASLNMWLLPPRRPCLSNARNKQTDRQTTVFWGPMLLSATYAWNRDKARGSSRFTWLPSSSRALTICPDPRLLAHLWRDTEGDKGTLEASLGFFRDGLFSIYKGKKLSTWAVSFYFKFLHMFFLTLSICCDVSMSDFTPDSVFCYFTRLYWCAV